MDWKAKRTSDRYPAPSKPPLPHRTNPPVIRTDAHHDRHLRLHSQMKRPLLEPTQLHLRPTMPGPLRKDKNTLPHFPHLRRRGLKRLQRTDPVRAIDKHGPAQAHEPAQEGDIAQGGLGGDGAVAREDGPEEEHVERGLVVADEDHGPRGEVLGAGDDVEADAGGEPHGEVEGAGGGPLRDAVVAEEAEVEAREDAVGGAEEEAGVGGEAAGEEGGVGGEP